MPTIRELIEQRRAFTNLSYREMSERAERAGLHIKYQTIQTLATETPKQWPKQAETIQALAEALDVPEQLVVLAFAASFGLDVRLERSRLASLLPSDTSALPGTVQDAIAQVVKALVATRAEESSHGAPTSKAGDPAVTNIAQAKSRRSGPSAPAKKAARRKPQQPQG